MQLKKTEQSILSEAQQRRCEDIVKIQTLLSEGYAPVQIKEMLHTTYFRIRRYATGDPFLLCRFQGDRESEAGRYKNVIIDLLTQNASLKYALEQVTALGYQGKRSAFEAYCRKLIAESGISYKPRRNTAGAPIDPHHATPTRHYLSKKDFMRHLWSGKELEQSDIDFVLKKYSKVAEIQQCILDFRKIYTEKNVSLGTIYRAIFSEHKRPSQIVCFRSAQ